jgi:hypothetical protein
MLFIVFHFFLSVQRFKLSQNCHPERSEGSGHQKYEILRFAQNDKLLCPKVYQKTPANKSPKINKKQTRQQLCVIPAGEPETC